MFTYLIEGAATVSQVGSAVSCHDPPDKYSEDCDNAGCLHADRCAEYLRIIGEKRKVDL